MEFSVNKFSFFLQTTGWGGSGQLTPIRFDMEKSKSCKNTSSRNTFCAVYGNGTSHDYDCPSLDTKKLNTQRTKIKLTTLIQG